MPDKASSGPGPLAGEPRERDPEDRSPAARVGTWLAWWVVLMSLWMMVDDSLATDELLAGAGAAAIAALVAELAGHQAAVRFRMRFEWLAPALRLPGQVASDTATVYAALWRRLIRGRAAGQRLRHRAGPYGDDTAEGMTRRALLIGGAQPRAE